MGGREGGGPRAMITLLVENSIVYHPAVAASRH